MASDGYRITPESFTDKMNILIYGDPGSGKTHLAGTCQDSPHMADVHVFNIDGGLMTLAERGDISATDIHSVADLEAAEAEARRAERYWERMQKADSRGITQKERDDAEAGADKAKAAVLQAKANLVVAEYDLKKAVVIAPISGQIGKTSAHVGDYVAPSKGALARIVQIDPIRVTFPLTDRAYIGWRAALQKGKAPEYRMRLMLPDGSAYGEEGKWDFDDNEMSKDTATIIMRLSFPNPDRLLIPNSYVTLLTDRKTPPKMPSIPQQAVFDLTGGSQGVWVLKDDETVEQRVVDVREMSEGWCPVVSGLKLGEKVVISGHGKLGPGMKVKVVEPTMNDDLDPNYKPPVKEN